MVMDLVEAGELLSVIRHHKDLKVAAGVAGEACGRETSRFYLGELVLALEYLHSEGIVHRGEGRRRQAQAAASPSLCWLNRRLCWHCAAPAPAVLSASDIKPENILVSADGHIKVE